MYRMQEKTSTCTYSYLSRKNSLGLPSITDNKQAFVRFTTYKVHPVNAVLRKEGRMDGRKDDGRKEGREVGRKDGRKEGRKEGRKVGRKEGRNEGRKEGRKVGT